jgi:hypothetical protein
MKLGADIVQAIRERIEPLDTEETRQRYREGSFPRADGVKNLDMRYRWDLWHAARGVEVIKVENGWYPEGINDTHIDTALRRIVAPLGSAS